MGTFGRPENRVNVVFLSLSFSPLRRSGFSERNRRRKLTKMVTTKSRAQKIRAHKMRVTDDRRHARVKLNGLRRMRAPFKKRAYYLRNPSLVVLAFPFSSLPLPRARALSRYTYTLPRSSFHPLFHTPLSVWRPQPRLLSSFLSVFLLFVRSSLLSVSFSLTLVFGYARERAAYILALSSSFSLTAIAVVADDDEEESRRGMRAYAARYYVMPADRRSDILCMLMPHNVGFVPLFSIYLFDPPPSALLSRAYAPRCIRTSCVCARTPLSGALVSRDLGRLIIRQGVADNPG